MTVWWCWDFIVWLRSEWAGYKVAVTQSIPARHHCRSVTADCSGLPYTTQLWHPFEIKVQFSYGKLNWDCSLFKLVSSALDLSEWNVLPVLEQQLTRPILTQACVHFTATFRYHTHSECAEVVLLTDLFSPSESQYFGNYNRWLHLIWVLLPVISREKGAWAIFLTQAWSPFQTFCCCINFPPWTQQQPTLSQGLLLVKCSASNLKFKFQTLPCLCDISFLLCLAASFN